MTRLSRAALALALALQPLAAIAQDEGADPGSDAAGSDAAAPAAASAGEAPSAAATPPLPAITVSEVLRQRLVDRVIASGLVEPVEQVDVAPLVEGQPVDELLADVGDVVEQGAVLARLSTATLELQVSELQANLAAVDAQIAQAQASLAQANANAAEASRQAARNAELAEGGSVPRAQAEQAQATADAAAAAVGVAEQGVVAAQAQRALAEAQIANAELLLSRAEVRAPVAGLIVARNARVGAVASAGGTPMFSIVRDNAMELSAEVSEQDLLKLRPGQATRMIAAEGGAPITGTVRRVEPAIDPSTRLGTARIAIDDPSQVVQGMFLQAEVTVEEADVLAVPVTAVGEDETGFTVMRVAGDRVERATVTTGIRDGGLIAVTEGLAEGDFVVTKAAVFVRDGDRINPVPEDAASAGGAAPAADAPAAPDDAATDAAAAPATDAVEPMADADQPAAPATRD